MTRADGSHSYRETFRRHRVVLCLPPLLAMVIAGAIVLTAGKSYTSSASLWVDNPAPLGSSLVTSSTGATTDPSSQEDTVLTELLTTQSFAVAVGDSSGLRSYLQTHGSGSINGRIVDALQKDVEATTPGPQVLQISFKGPTPQVSQSVVNALVSELKTSSAKYGATYAISEVSYYRAQAAAAQKALTAARTAATQYLALHPAAKAENDPSYAALSAAVQSASNELASASAALTQAQSGLSTDANSPVLTVEDPATLLPTTGTSKRKIAEGVVGGLVAGLLVSLFVVILLTPARPDEFDEQLAPRAVEGSAAGHDPVRRTASSASTESKSSKSLELRVSRPDEGRSTSLRRLPKSGS